MPTIESKWTWGNITAVIAAIATMLTVGITVYTWGQEWGKLLTRVSGLEEQARQSSIDSRTLLTVQTDVAYIKQMVTDLRSVAVTGDISCPMESPVLVASYCRTRPNGVSLD